MIFKSVSGVSRGQEGAAFGVGVAARLNTRTGARLVAPLAHQAVRDHKTALCRGKAEESVYLLRSAAAHSFVIVHALADPPG